MATYTTLRNGSKGSEVKKLQQALVDAGYDVGKAGADGIYGSGTAAAVKAYQKANGLSVDGIAGNQTLGKLYGGSSSSTTTTTTAPKDTSFKYEEFKYQDIGESDTVKQAEALLQQRMANKPGEHQSPWQSQLNDTLNKILNREKFSYDLNGDALYQQYKDQYATQGKQASMDVMGQAAAMTGGYGNSYAQTVGQQTYQGYLQQLNDKVPELYQIALNQYNQEGQDLKDQATILNTLDQQDYSKYRDSVSDYYTDLQYLTDRADTAYDREVANRDLALNLWADEQGYNHQTSESNKKYAYDTAMAMVSLGVTPSAEILNAAGISLADAQAMAKKVAANAAASKSSSTKKSTDDDDYDDDDDDDDDDDVVAGGFSGTTYSAAVDYMKKYGVPTGSAAGMMTQQEWARRKASYKATGTGGSEVKNYDSYAEYIQDYVAYQLEKNSK